MKPLQTQSLHWRISDEEKFFDILIFALHNISYSLECPAQDEQAAMAQANLVYMPRALAS